MHYSRPFLILITFFTNLSPRMAESHVCLFSNPFVICYFLGLKIIIKPSCWIIPCWQFIVNTESRVLTRKSYNFKAKFIGNNHFQLHVSCSMFKWLSRIVIVGYLISVTKLWSCFSKDFKWNAPRCLCFWKTDDPDWLPPPPHTAPTRPN
jgi:hypothetical protein